MRVVVLTGAGVSAESGLATFRDAGGLWEGHRPEDVATPEAFADDPDLVQRFYDARRASLLTAEPNAAHQALAALEHVLGHDLLLVTQNIDDLHERGGSVRVLHMHGRLRSAWCTTCDHRMPWDGTLADEPPCPTCRTRTLRPDVVWFGEVPHHVPAVVDAVVAADLFVSIGTSGAVYPAAGFAHHARAHGAHTLELNLVAGQGSHLFDEHRAGPATTVVPAWVDEVLAAVGSQPLS